jgi:phage-related minor tail protein
MADTTAPDRLVVGIDADLSSLSQSLSQAGRDVSSFATGTVGDASRSMTNAFGSSFASLTSSVTKAAESGKFSIHDMVESMLQDLARVAIRQSIVTPIENAARSVANAAVTAVAGLAVGGPVGPGSAYMVGEHGPELFVPSGNGDIVPGAAAAGARSQIVLNVQTPNAQSFLKSQSQIAAMMTRALSRGQRNL